MATTRQTREARRLELAAQDSPPELLPVDVADAVANLQPALERLRRGEWRLIAMGPATASERDEARMFPVHLANLSAVIRARQ